MVTGIICYIYRNRRHYARFEQDGEPERLGDWFTAQIPRDKEKRAAWLRGTEQIIELETAQRAHFDIAHCKSIGVPTTVELNNQFSFEIIYEEKLLLFQRIQENDPVQLGTLEEDWSYVLDLNHRTFSINGRIHFALENLPNKISSHVGSI